MNAASLLPILLIVLAFVLLFVLPARQRKRMAQRQTSLQQSLMIGTPVMMSSGLYGSVAGLQEETVDVQVAPGTVVRFARAAVLEVKSTEADEAAGAKGAAVAPSVNSGPEDKTAESS